MGEWYNRKSTFWEIFNSTTSIAAIEKDGKHLLADLKPESWFAPGMHRREYMIKTPNARKRLDLGKVVSLPSVILKLWSGNYQSRANVSS
jgi:hypothetical protein